MPFVFGEIKCRFGYKKGQLGFLERQKQLINSGIKISIPESFESSAKVSEQIHFFSVQK